MLIELHAHTAEHSPCSMIAAEALAGLVSGRGAQGLVLTDHHYLWPPEELEDLRRRTGLPHGFVLLSGQEVTTVDFGDVLVYGAPVSIPFGISLDDLRAACPRAALVWAHPYRSHRRPLAAELLHEAFDAVEVVNPHTGRGGNEAGLRDWHDWGFVGISGSDIHSDNLPLFIPTKFDHDVATLDDLVASIKLGRCRPCPDFRPITVR